MRFEGEEIDGFRVQVRQFKGYIDKPLAIDETVSLIVTAKVTAVDHSINQRDHHLYRNHILKIEDVSVT